MKRNLVALQVEVAAIGSASIPTGDDLDAEDLQSREMAGGWCSISMIYE